MPFKKVGKKYKSPSGRIYTKKQVKMYYATKGFKKSKIRGKRKKGQWGFLIICLSKIKGVKKTKNQLTFKNVSVLAKPKARPKPKIK